ncbi:hypothetical protein RRG08_045703 [Elysia crispata]|uniref:Uncharacterized protein n=1 Tax=Elysia crispata TaxID=231223 RepID=A0AAE1D8R0_9GAST|nr:hypothetical protein RRG08_045703 [Elysia crispata]
MPSALVVVSASVDAVSTDGCQHWWLVFAGATVDEVSTGGWLIFAGATVDEVSTGATGDKVSTGGWSLLVLLLMRSALHWWLVFAGATVDEVSTGGWSLLVLQLKPSGVVPGLCFQCWRQSNPKRWLWWW